MIFPSYRSRVAATVATVVVAAFALAPPAHACSKVSFFTSRYPGITHFVGTATSDTVLAGAGPVRLRTKAGRSASDTSRLIYGQVVEVERLGQTVSPTLRDAVPAAGSRVILVPWGYAPDCETLPWTQSVLWVQTGTRALFSATLREREHWVNGVPTLDVHTPYTTPYPSERSLRFARISARAEPGVPESMLTPEQLLELYDLLPEDALMAADPDSAVAPLRRWMRSHPELVGRIPAAHIARMVLGQAETARVQATTSPLAGTYRFVLRVPSGDSVIFFARTAVHPTGRLRDLQAAAVRPRSETSTSLEPAPSPGYYLMAYIATSPEELPSVRTYDRLRRQGYFASLFAPDVETSDSTVWQGSVDLIEHAARMLPPGELRSQIEAANTTMWSMLRSGERTFVPGRFVRRADGSVHYTLDAKRYGAQVLSIRGERVTLEYFRER